MTAIFKPASRGPLEHYMEKMLQRNSLPPLHPCHCIGPQKGEPACPCQMRGVTIENGRYVRRQDLGPAPTFPAIDPSLLEKT